MFERSVSFVKIQNQETMKVQLFVPPQGYVAARWTEGTSMPPLGLLSLAAVLEKEGIEVDFVPADVLGYSWKDVKKRIIEFSPDIVGATTTTENRFDSFHLIKLVKKISPRIVTILGGPHITMAGEDTISNIHEIDHLVYVGEVCFVVAADMLDMSPKGSICLVGPDSYDKGVVMTHFLSLWLFSREKDVRSLRLTIAKGG